MKNTLSLFLVLLLLESCTNAPTTESQADKIKKVETSLSNPVYIEGDSLWSIEERMAHYGVPGVSLAVIKDGKIDWVKTYGVVDKESKAPVIPTTLFQAGSISKPVAAYGALKLVEQNKINLDEDINTYLKSWQLPSNEFTKDKKVSLKHLVNHSAGVTVHGFLGYSPDLQVPTLIEVLNGTAPANSGPIFVNKIPEQSFRYSGGGYTIMQQMMIDVEGKPFPQIMKELVLQPLGMNNSTYDQPLQTEQLVNASTGYLPDGTMTKGKRHTYPEMAAAGLWTTAEDLAKFITNIQKTQKGESESVLSKDMTSKMLTPFVEDFIGLGVFVNTMKDEVYFGHGGWNEGFSSEFIAHKDKGYGVVVLTNSNQPEFISELIRSVALTYAWDDFVPVYQKMKLDETMIGRISGRYKVNGNELLEVYSENNKLYIRDLGGVPTELIQISESSFARRESSDLIQFAKNKETEKMDMQTSDPNKGKMLSTYPQLNTDEKIPMELLMAGEFEQALAAYKALFNQDPNDPTINESNINSLGYRLLNKGNTKLAQSLFKVMITLYPNSSNAYDSYAESCMKNGDIDLAIENYKKSVALDPRNTNAQSLIEELQKKKMAN